MIKSSAHCDNRATRAAPPRRRSYVGRCDCGSVRYEVTLALSERDPRTRSVWEHSVAPRQFQLLAGHENLIGYQFAAEDVHHFFCTRCQVRAFSHCAPDASEGYYTVDVKALCVVELTLAPAAQKNS